MAKTDEFQRLIDRLASDLSAQSLRVQPGEVSRLNRRT